MPRRKSVVSKKSRKKSRASEITQLKRLIIRLIKKFEEDIAHPGDFSDFWGEKESPVSVIAKLSQILLKLFTIADPKGSRKRIKEELTEEDFTILRFFLEDHKLRKADSDSSAVP